MGECVRLISEYHETTKNPTQKGWEEFYSVIQGFEGLTYVTKELCALLPDLEVKSIKQYIFHRVIGQTWNGYANEMLIIKELNAEFPSCEILKTSFEVDHEYCIDAEMFHNTDLLLGIQIKPISYRKMNTEYQRQAKENHRQKNIQYQNLYAPYVYVYYDNHKIVDKKELLNQISTIIYFNIWTMPLPTPKGENQQEFMARCMEELKSEFPDREQRLAVCYTQWREGK